MTDTADSQVDIIELARLPPPEDGQLMQALWVRRSAREYRVDELRADLLSGVLWAAGGINRPATGGRTAPSAHGWMEIDVYAALARGMYRYDPAGHSLRLAVAQDLRAATGRQDYVGQAPLNLVYVADFTRMGDASDEDRAFFAATDAAAMAQNVYLYCAAKGLASVLRGLIDRKRLAGAMALGAAQRIVLAQTVGYPAV